MHHIATISLAEGHKILEVVFTDKYKQPYEVRLKPKVLIVCPACSTHYHASSGWMFVGKQYEIGEDFFYRQPDEPMLLKAQVQELWQQFKEWAEEFDCVKIEPTQADGLREIKIYGFDEAEINKDEGE